MFSGTNQKIKRLVIRAKAKQAVGKMNEKIFLSMYHELHLLNIMMTVLNNVLAKLPKLVLPYVFYTLVKHKHLPTVPLGVVSSEGGLEHKIIELPRL